MHRTRLLSPLHNSNCPSCSSTPTQKSVATLAPAEKTNATSRRRSAREEPAALLRAVWGVTRPLTLACTFPRLEMRATKESTSEEAVKSTTVFSSLPVELRQRAMFLLPPGRRSVSTETKSMRTWGACAATANARAAPSTFVRSTADKERAKHARTIRRRGEDWRQLRKLGRS